MSPPAPASILPETNQDVDAMKISKRQFSTCFWITLAVAILLILVGIGLGVYFGVIRPMLVKEEIQVKFNDTCTWLKDVPLNATRDGQPVFTSLFSGQVGPTRMLSICNMMDQNSRPPLEEWYGAAYLNRTDEADFDVNIRANLEAIFGKDSKNKLLWTGCFFECIDEDKNIWKNNCDTVPLNKFTNFCDRGTWKDTLAKLQNDDVNNLRKDPVYIVKDYGHPNSCWKLFLPKEMVKIMDQPSGLVEPYLPFACIISGKQSSAERQDPCNEL